MKLSQPYRAASFEEHEAYAGALADAEPDTFANIVYSLLPKGSDANTAKDIPLHSTWHTHQGLAQAGLWWSHRSPRRQIFVTRAHESL
jgi:hypothetical protein